jgi:hypothetical protein
LLAKSGRKHRNGTLNEIDAGGSLTSIPVEGGVGLHEERHVCDMNANIISAVVIGFDGERVIEIPSGFRINSEESFFSEIFTGLQLVFRDAEKRVASIQLSVWISNND